MGWRLGGRRCQRRLQYASCACEAPGRRRVRRADPDPERVGDVDGDDEAVVFVREDVAVRHCGARVACRLRGRAPRRGMSRMQALGVAEAGCSSFRHT
eukprot:37479-Chlamydomonas_euryale.AAC.1